MFAIARIRNLSDMHHNVESTAGGGEPGDGIGAEGIWNLRIFVGLDPSIPGRRLSQIFTVLQQYSTRWHCGEENGAEPDW